MIVGLLCVVAVVAAGRGVLVRTILVEGADWLKGLRDVCLSCFGRQSELSEVWRKRERAD